MTKSRFLIHQFVLSAATLIGVLGMAWGGPPNQKIESPRFAYVANPADDTVSTYAIDAATGQLLPRGYVVTGRIGAGSKPSAVAVDPSNKFLYVTNEGHQNIQAFKIDPSTGALTRIGLFPATGFSPKFIAVHPNGKFVYVASQGSNGVSGFIMDPRTGLAAMRQNFFPAGERPCSIAVHPNGLYLYVANRGADSANADGTISAFAIDQTTGALKFVNNLPAGKHPSSVAVYPHPNGAFAYVTNEDSSNISSYSIDQHTGALADWQSYPVDSSPRVTHPTSITLDPFTRHFAYVTYAAKDSSTGFSSMGVMAYEITGSGSQLSPIGDASVGAGPASIVMAANGSFVYVANKDSNEISAFSRDIATGAITPLDRYGTTRARSNPSSIAIANGIGRSLQTKFAYATNGAFSPSHTATISGFRIALAGETLPGGQAARGGELVSLAGSPFAAGLGFSPNFIAMGTGDRFMYVADGHSPTASTYRIDPISGAVTQVGRPVQAGRYPDYIGLDPAGRFAYVSNSGGDVSIFTVNRVSGMLVPSGTLKTPFPGGITVEPSGRFAYVAKDDFFGKIFAFRVNNPRTGALAPLGTYSAGKSSNSVAMDPLGKFLYVSNNGPDDRSEKGSISAYTIDPITGNLKEITGSPFPAGFATGRITMDQNGRFLYVLNSGVYTTPLLPAGDVSIYRINPISGALAPIGSPVPTGVGPSFIAIDPSNKFAYVANIFSDNISAYEVNASNGLLSPLGQYSSTLGPNAVGIFGTFE